MLKEISVEILQKCPNNCIHCSSMSGCNSKEIMDYETYKSVVLDAKRLGAKTVCISGGEPFLHPLLGDMIELNHSLKLDTYIYTSGIVLDGEKHVAIPKGKLMELKGNPKIIFNIESPEEETYGEIMGTEGCFGLLEESIRNAVACMLETEANFVPMKQNVSQITHLADMCQEIGIGKINFLRLVPQGRAKNNMHKLTLDKEDEGTLRDSIRELESRDGIQIRVGIPLSGIVSKDGDCHRCNAGIGKLNVRYDGTVFPCEAFKSLDAPKCFHGMKPENIYHKSLYDIYHQSPYLRAVRGCFYKCQNTLTNEICIGQICTKYGNAED